MASQGEYQSGITKLLFAMDEAEFAANKAVVDVSDEQAELFAALSTFIEFQYRLERVALHSVINSGPSSNSAATVANSAGRSFLELFDDAVNESTDLAIANTAVQDCMAKADTALSASNKIGEGYGVIIQAARLIFKSLQIQHSAVTELNDLNKAQVNIALPTARRHTELYKDSL